MANSEPLLDIAASLADGTAVDWVSAEASVSTDDERQMLAELRFIGDMTRASRNESPELPARTWGPLRISEYVGRGTFGDVYRARDTRLDREVALKILRRRERDDHEESTVIEEGRLLARVRHPNVATVYGAERIDGQVGVWMEFVHGKTLEDELRAGGPFDLHRVIRIGSELAGALTTVHRAGLIHRDVKAQNVMCDADGRIVLTDFGAGCDLQVTMADAAREFAGTPISVAPEMLAGQPATPQSDVYSLGVLLYHLLTETYPVRGKSLKEIREAHADGRRSPLAEVRPDLPAAFVRIVDRAIDPDPANRYNSPEVLRSELAALIHFPDARSAGRPGWRLPVALAVFGSLSVWLATGSRLTGGGSLNPETELAEIVTLAEHGRLEEAYERALAVRSGAPGSPAAANGVAYALTYAGFLDEAVRAIDDVAGGSPDYFKQNAWWAPTALLYQRKFDRFLQTMENSDTQSVRLYRAITELERRQPVKAIAHVSGVESSGASTFSPLVASLHAALIGPRGGAVEMIRSVADQRNVAGDDDGEITFKQAQILSVAGDPQSALAALNEAREQGFVCVRCFDSSSILEPVRALPGYARVRERARARQLTFARRFGLTLSDR